MIDLGADTDAVRVHVEAMRAGTSTLRERLSTLGTTIRAVDWHGADAEGFCATAESLFSEAGTVLESIDRRSDELLEHADEQDRASSADGEGSAAGGTTGPGGDDAGKVKDPRGR